MRVDSVFFARLIGDQFINPSHSRGTEARELRKRAQTLASQLSCSFDRLSEIIARNRFIGMFTDSQNSSDQG